MYITINNIKGEKKIDLSYSIQNFDSSMEIAVIRMLSDNVQYQILKLRSVMDPISDTKKMIPSGTYAGRELLSVVEGMVELNQFVVDDQVIKKNKLKGITEMIISLDELNSSDNLEDRHPSNTLFTYHVTDDKDFTHFPYSRLPISKVAAAACQSLPMAISGSRFCAVFCQWHKYVANWVKKQHKVKEDSGNIFKIENIGKHWQKEAQLRNRIKWNKFYIVLKWQRLAKCGTSKLQQKAA